MEAIAETEEDLEGLMPVFTPNNNCKKGKSMASESTEKAMESNTDTK